MAAQLQLVLGDRQLLAGRDPDALLDDVDPGHHLGHAVLDLDAGVHLQEEVLAVLEQALDRAGAGVADGRGGVGGDLADLGPQLRVDGRRRCLLDQLLMAALQRAVTLAEVDHVAVGVGHHLDLDVARVGQVTLQVDGGVAEELLTLASGALEGVLQLVLGQRHPEALAATAAGRLDRHRVADGLVDHLAGILDGLDRLGGTGHDRYAGLLHQLARTGLGAHGLDRRRRGTDEHDPGVLERLGEGGVLGQEAVAGMDRLGAGTLDRVDDLVDRQVALGCRSGPEQVGLVGALDMDGVAVELGVHRNGADSELLTGADDSDRDLAAVGYQDLREHRGALTLPSGHKQRPAERSSTRRAGPCRRRPCRLTPHR